MALYLKVVADPNDADYVTRLEKIDEETLELVRPVINAIKAWEPDSTEPYSRNWLNGYKTYVESGLVTEDQFNTFDEDFVPYIPDYDDGPHTINHVELLDITEVEVFL